MTLLYIIIGVVLVVAILLALTGFPDIMRYRRIRKM
jgi:hypothetical protein